MSLSGPSEKTVEVDYATSDVGATAATDYVSTTGTLTFAPGDIEEQIDVTVIGDVDVEGDEAVAMDLSAETNATVADPSGVLTITDDDAVAKTATALTVVVVKRSKKVIARGVFEAAEEGAQVRMVLQVRRDGRFRRVSGKRIAVSSLTDRDADTIVDASYRAEFRLPKAGRYRFRVVFAGSDSLERSIGTRRFRV